MDDNKQYIEKLSSLYDATRQDHLLLLYCSMEKGRGRIEDIAPAFCRVVDAYLEAVRLHLEKNPDDCDNVMFFEDRDGWQETVEGLHALCTKAQHYADYNAKELKAEIASEYKSLDISLTQIMDEAGVYDDDFRCDYDAFVKSYK